MTKKVEDIMSKKLQTVAPETSLKDAYALMTEKHVRHLLIVNKSSGELLGIISDRDAKKFLSPFAGSATATDRDNATLNIKLEKIMHKEVITAKASDTVKSLVEKILQKKISSIPVVGDDGKPVGMVTTSDLLKVMLSML